MKPPTITAVFEDYELHLEGGRRLPIENLKHGISTCWQQDIRSVWLPTGHPFLSEWDTFLAGAKGANWYHGPTGEKAAAPWFIDCKRKDGRRVLLINAERAAPDWPELHNLAAPDLLAHVVQVQQVTGTVICERSHAAGNIGAQWIHRFARHEWIEPLRHEIVGRLPSQADPVTWKSLFVGHIHWKRALTPAERRYKFVHHFDVNAAYLAVAARCDLGAGEPVAIEDFRPNTRSVYRARVRPNDSLWNGRDLPSPLGPVGSNSSTWEGWWHEPQLRFAIEHGWSVLILEGWLFPETHATLRTWGEAAWKARQELQGPSRAMVKRIINGSMGFIGRHERPDWYGFITSECRRRRLNDIHTQYSGNDHLPGNKALPFCLSADGLIYASDEPDPAKACPFIMRVPTSLGGYKCERSIRMPADSFDRISARDLPAYIDAQEAIG